MATTPFQTRGKGPRGYSRCVDGCVPPPLLAGARRPTTALGCRCPAEPQRGSSHAPHQHQRALWLGASRRPRAAAVGGPFLPLGAFAPAPVAACGTPSTSPETCTIPAEELCQLSLHLTTFNVLSLGKPGEDREGQAVGEGLAYQPARAALLADQLHRQDVHVAFLQETRADSGQSSAGRYIRFASGATKGQFGTEIWFQRDHVVLSGSPTGSCVQFTKESFTVLAADPRRLLVRFQQGSFSVLFVAVHGPHRATEQCIIESWWQETARLIRHYCRQSLVVMGGDCNASVGSITSRHVGGVAAEDEDTAGESLHGLLRAFDLCLPATMPHCHRGTSFTYVQKHGGQLCRPDLLRCH